MKRDYIKTCKLIWAALAASILFMLPLMLLRITNENNNRSVIFAGGPGLYSNLEQQVNAGMPQSELDLLKSAGLRAFLISESDLISAYAENRADTIGLTSQMPKTGYDSSLLDKIRRSGFEPVILLEKLEYSDSFYEHLSSAIDYFEIKYILINPANKNPSPNQGTDNMYSRNLYPTNDHYLYKLAYIIEDYKLIAFLMENRDQTGYVDENRILQIAEASGYRTNRAFSIANSLLGDAPPDEAVYAWLRAVVDRNIRLIVIEPDTIDFTSLYKASELIRKKGYTFNIGVQEMNTGIPDMAAIIPVILNLLAAIALYIMYISKQCNKSMGPDSQKFQRHAFIKNITNLLLFLCATLATIYIVLMLFRWVPLPETIKSGLPAFKAIQNIFPESNTTMGIVMAFIAAVVYPSLANLLIIRFNNSPAAESLSIIRKIAISVSIMLAISLAGSAVVISSMSDIRYQMHLANFNPVIPAFIIPLLLYPFHLPGPDRAVILTAHLENQLAGAKLRPKSILFILLYISFIAVIMFFYLARNGNWGIAPASNIELELRKALETLLYARPRVKEFLVGYPGLFLFVYTYSRGGNNALRNNAFRINSFRGYSFSFTAGLFSVITSISILNSFCHGFTPVYTSAARTAGGLLIGIITGSIAVILYRAYLSLANR